MRKLAVGSGAFAAGIIISYYLYDHLMWPVFAGSLLICFLLCLSVRKDIGILLQLFFLMSSLGLTYFSLYNSAAVKNAEAYSCSENFTALVSDYPEEYDNYSRVRVKLYGNSQKCTALLYDYYKNTAKLEPGDRICFSANMRSMFSSRSNASESNISKGIFLTGRLTSEITYLKKGIHAAWASKYISHAVAGLIQDLFPEDTVPYLRALLLGRKTEFYSDNNVYPVMLRSGFMHTVAISGMHISFIAGFCLIVFGNRKRGTIASLLFIWFFIFMSGNTPSAARAGIMQTVLLLAPFFKRENDPLTSVFFALAILLLINPYSAGSISLQMSFAAVLGIILFAARINDALLSAVKNKNILHIIRYPIGVFSSSVGVMAFTVPLSALHFGYVSLLSFITNVFALWAVPLCFCGAYICILLYLILPGPAVFLAGKIAYLCRYIFIVCSAVSAVPYAVIPYEGEITIFLFVLVYLLFILFSRSEFSQLKRLIIPGSLSLIIILSYFLYFRIDSDTDKAVFTVMDAGQGECVTAFTGNRTIVVDCGSSDYYMQPGVDCADYLYTRGQKNIDALILTHLHADHVNCVCQLIELMDVKSIFIPVNTDDSDGFYKIIKQTADKNGTSIILVDADAAITLGDMKAELYPSYIWTENNESCMAVKIDVFGRTFLITGDGTYLNEMLLCKKQSIGDVDVLVAGHHGANSSSCTAFLERVTPEYSVISVGKNNQYGHPSVYAIGRMKSEGINVLRTDLCGRVSFIIN